MAPREGRELTQAPRHCQAKQGFGGGAATEVMAIRFLGEPRAQAAASVRQRPSKPRQHAIAPDQRDSDIDGRGNRAAGHRDPQRLGHFTQPRSSTFRNGSDHRVQARGVPFGKARQPVGQLLQQRRRFRIEELGGRLGIVVRRSP